MRNLYKTYQKMAKCGATSLDRFLTENRIIDYKIADLSDKYTEEYIQNQLELFPDLILHLPGHAVNFIITPQRYTLNEKTTLSPIFTVWEEVSSQDFDYLESLSTSEFALCEDKKLLSEALIVTHHEDCYKPFSAAHYDSDWHAFAIINFIQQATQNLINTEIIKGGKKRETY
jgi:hypothetical protein